MKNNSKFLQTETYSTKNLLAMIDLLLEKLVEYEDCTLCRIYNCQDNRCLDADLCKNMLFDGVLKRVVEKNSITPLRRLEKGKNAGIFFT